MCFRIYQFYYEWVSIYVRYNGLIYPIRASERCSAEKRKTINGEDILFSLGALGFDNYMECVRVYLQKYRKSLTGMKTKKRRDDEDGKDEEAFGM